VQFNHRVLGYVLVLLGLWVFWQARRSALAGVRLRFGWMALALVLQVVLGIVTVLNVAPLELAISHQLLAVILFLTALRARFEAGYPARQSLRG
jgi:heme a synthase